MIKWIKSALIILSFFSAKFVYAVNFPEIPTPFRYVNDYTAALSAAEKQALEARLNQYSQKTSSQIAVVMIPSTEEYEIAQYTFELGDKWGIGRKQLNNGVLMLIAKNDRRIFIATGQGLEGVLPDAFLSQLIRQVILPYFKQGQFAQGIAQGLEHIIAASQGEYSAYEENDTWQDYIPVIMIVLFILFVLFGELNWRKTPYISPSHRHHTPEMQRRQSVMARRAQMGGFNSGFGSGIGGGSSGGFGGGGFGGGGAGGSW